MMIDFNKYHRKEKKYNEYKKPDLINKKESQKNLKKTGNNHGNSKFNTQYLKELSMNTINHNPHGISKKKSTIILQKEEKKKGKEYEIRSSDAPLGCAGTTARASIDSF